MQQPHPVNLPGQVDISLIGAPGGSAMGFRSSDRADGVPKSRGSGRADSRGAEVATGDQEFLFAPAERASTSSGASAGEGPSAGPAVQYSSPSGEVQLGMPLDSPSIEEASIPNPGLGRGTGSGYLQQKSAKSKRTGPTPTELLAELLAERGIGTGKRRGLSGPRPPVQLSSPPRPWVWWLCQPCCVYRDQGCQDPSLLAVTTFCCCLPLTEPVRMYERQTGEEYVGPFQWKWNDTSCCACCLPWEAKYDRQKAALLRGQAEAMMRGQIQESEMQAAAGRKQKNPAAPKQLTMTPVAR